MHNTENPAESTAEEAVFETGTLAPVAREVDPWFEDDAEVRSMDPWASTRGLLFLFLGVVGVLAVGWGTGIFAMPGSQAGAQECARVCVSMGTEVASFTDGTCVCR